MTNAEFYKKEIDEIIEDNASLRKFYLDHKVIKEHESGYSLVTKIHYWLNDEYKKPETDWSKVKRGIEISVSDDGTNWYGSHFLYAYDTNFERPIITYTNNMFSKEMFGNWKYAKLLGEEK